MTKTDPSTQRFRAELRAQRQTRTAAELRETAKRQRREDNEWRKQVEEWKAGRGPRPPDIGSDQGK